MEIPLEDLECQRQAIAAAVGVLDGQVRNSFDNSNLFGIQANLTDLTPGQIEENKRRVLAGNGVSEGEYYFVIETKGTNNIEDQRGLTESERIKIKCALKHFDALGIEAKLEYRPYVAPVKDYHADFKPKVPAP